MMHETKQGPASEGNPPPVQQLPSLLPKRSLPTTIFWAAVAGGLAFLAAWVLFGASPAVIGGAVGATVGSVLSPRRRKTPAQEYRRDA